MGVRLKKITNVKFINKLTGEVVLMIKEAEAEDWVPPYEKIDRGLWSVYSYSCEEADDVLNGGGSK